MKNLKVTGMKGNKRIIFPKRLENNKEQDLFRLKKIVNEETKKYKDEFIDERGRDANENHRDRKYKAAQKELKNVLKEENNIIIES